MRARDKTVASGTRARRTARSDETYQVERRGASTVQRRYRVAQQVFSQALSRAAALAQLLWRFLVDVGASGWATAVIILRGGGELRSGFVRLSYGELSDGGAALLGALISLTPGTTMVDLDPERREFLLHLLDTSRAEATLAAIERDYRRLASVLFGSRR
ncbi:MAG: Na+/H+ antiporter subunit E [Gammaproteobacteria bacterium]